MSEIKRYSLEFCGGDTVGPCTADLSLDNDGEYVTYAQHAEEVARLRADLASTQRRNTYLEKLVGSYVPGKAQAALEESEQANATLRAEVDALKAERDDARGVLASVTDCLNTFARENGAAEENNYLSLAAALSGGAA